MLAIIHNFEQRSDAWYNIRLGRFTGSDFHTFLGKSATKDRLILEKATEHITGKPTNDDHFVSADMQRGIDNEDYARQLYEAQTLQNVEQIGFAELDEFVGCSPDGLVGTDGIIEIKCLTSDSEILTSKGFIPIKDVSDNDFVAEYTKERKIRFVKPNFVLHKDYDGDIYKFYRYNKLTMSLTGNHRVIYFDKNNEIQECLAENFGIGYHKHIPVGGYVEGTQELTDLQKFKIAVNADGSIPKTMKGSRIIFDFSKNRKKEKIKNLLDKLGFEYEIKKEREFNDNSKNSQRFYIKLNDNSGFEYKKGLSSIIDLDKCSSLQANQFIEELVNWDGTRNQSNVIEYTSKNKEDIDFVSALCVLANKKSNICKCSDCYMITISGYGSQSKNTRQCLNFKNDKFNKGQKIVKEHYKGQVHCVNVDSGMFVARMPDSCAFITGNCPKNSVFVDQIISGKVKPEYFTQMQFNMYVLNRKWCDYIAYNENFPLLVRRIPRDEEYIEKIKSALAEVVASAKQIIADFQKAQNTPVIDKTEPKEKTKRIIKKNGSEKDLHSA